VLVGNLGRGGLGALARDVGDRHVGPSLGEAAGHLAAQSAAPARHHRRLSVQPELLEQRHTNHSTGDRHKDGTISGGWSRDRKKPGDRFA